MKNQVSVIIPCHDLERFLPECVESIKAQTVRPEEIVIIHDGCSDPIAFAGTTTVFREKNKGVARSRDEGVKLSTSPLILFVDADDTLAENFIEFSLDEIRLADIVYTDVLLWSKWSNSPFENKWYETPKKIDYKTLYARNYIVVTSLMKREVYEKIGGFDPKLTMYEDWWFYIQAIKLKFKFRKANTFLKYRQRLDSRNRQNDEERRKAHECITNMARKRYGFPKN